MRLSTALTATAFLAVLVAGPGCPARPPGSSSNNDSSDSGSGGGDSGKTEDEDSGDAGNNDDSANNDDNDAGNNDDSANNDNNDSGNNDDNNSGNDSGNDSGNNNDDNDSGGNSGGSGYNENYTGNLAGGDQQLNSGEYVDRYTVSARPGQTITIDMRSTSNLDPYILLRGPSGQNQDNDDWNGDRTHSRVEHRVTEGGTFEIGATSFQPGETGAYTLTVQVGDGPASGGGDSGGGGGGGNSGGGGK